MKDYEKQAVQEAFTAFFENLKEKTSEGLHNWYEYTKDTPTERGGEIFLTSYIEPLTADLPFGELFGGYCAEYVDLLRHEFEVDKRNELAHLKEENSKKPAREQESLDTLMEKASTNVSESYAENKLDLIRVRVGLTIDNTLFYSVNIDAPSFTQKDDVFFESYEQVTDRESASAAVNELKDHLDDIDRAQQQASSGMTM